mmetsp:Transcript_73947/g.173459  ORF Transcript_73947/g.173459 Transcript_73947/m.173459 type:complete len:272 (+) Transcript_73947:1001-1816(+)
MVKNWRIMSARKMMSMHRLMARSMSTCISKRPTCRGVMRATNTMAMVVTICQTMRQRLLSGLITYQRFAALNFLVFSARMIIICTLRFSSKLAVVAGPCRKSLLGPIGIGASSIPSTSPTSMDADSCMPSARTGEDVSGMYALSAEWSDLMSDTTTRGRFGEARALPGPLLADSSTFNEELDLLSGPSACEPDHAEMRLRGGGSWTLFTWVTSRSCRFCCSSCATCACCVSSSAVSWLRRSRHLSFWPSADINEFCCCSMALRSRNHRAPA